MTRTRRLAAALMLAAGLLLALPGLASAAAPPGEAYLRLAHLSPDTPNVDVYLASVSDPDERFTVAGVSYGAVSDYRSLPTGTYTVSMRTAGAPAGSPPVISTTLTTQPGDAYTVAGVGLYDALGLTVLDDELGTPHPGQARVRVVNAAATAPMVDLTVDGGPVLATGLGFAKSSGYQSVPTGDWSVQVATPAGGIPTSLPIDIASNAVYTVLLLDKGGRLSAELHLDSAGATAVPLGGVDTGMGGTAGSSWGTPEWLLLSAAGIGAVLLAVRLRREPRR